MTSTQRNGPAERRRRLFWRAAASLAMSGALITAGLAVAMPAAATGNTLRIDPAVQYAPQDGTFVAHVRQAADVATSGAGATITFDPALLQITTVTRGAGYASAPVFNGASATAIAAANTSGSLVGVSAAFFPPDSVPAGEADVIDVTFHAIGCGTAELGLPTGVNDASLLDGTDGSYGNALPVTAIGGSVVLCNSLRIDPAAGSVPQDGTFVAHVVQNTSVPTSGAGATITFDPALLQITAVARGSGYSAAPVFNGASANAIAAANTTGSLVGVSAAFFPPDSVPAGEANVIDVTFHAIACGTSPIGLPTGVNDATLLDGRDATYGSALPLSAVGGSVTTCAAATPTPSTTPTPAGSPTASPSPSPSPSPTPPPGNSIRIEPASTKVAKDGTVSVRVVQNGEFAIGGITATVAFDPTILQLVGVTPSQAYADPSLHVQIPALAGDAATTTTIANANKTGAVYQINATFQHDTILKPSLPAGDADFLTLQFKAIACGTSPLLLPNDSADNVLLDGRPDTYLKPVPTRTVNGSVSVCDAQSTPAPTVPAGNSVRIAPYTTLVIKNGGFTVRVVQKSALATGGTTATVLFDPTMLQIVSITKAAAFAGSAFFQGAAAKDIKAANASGRLNQVAAAYVAPGNLPAGENDFISIEFKSIACGESLLLLPNDTALTSIVDGRDGTYGQVLAITTVKGVVQACDKNAKPTPRPTRTPSPTTAPTTPPTQAPPPPPTSEVTPPTTGGEVPTPVPSASDAGPVAAPVPTGSPKLAVVAVSVKRAAPVATMPPSTSVAFVGLGVAAVIGGLAIVLVMAFALVGSLVIPLVVVRALRSRNGRQIGNGTATRD